MITLEKAIEISVMAHEFQRDKCGKPYIAHPIRVASKFFEEKYIITALLHDVLEDGNDGIKNKLRYALRDDNEILEALGLLNHKKNTSYSEYVKDLSQNELARTVKMADLTDNMNEERCNIALSLMDTQDEKDRFKRKQATYYDSYLFLEKISNSTK